MNLITDTWRGLVRRKLWPLALLLVGALVAVPLLLSKDPVSTASTQPANAVRKDEGLPATFVSASEPAETGARRRVLGVPKDPFEPRALPKVKKVKKVKKAEKQTAVAKPSTSGEAAPAPSAGSGSSGGGAPEGPAVPPVSAAPAPAPTYPLYSIKVRFGKTDGAKTTRTLERLRVLPSEQSPLLVYRGVEDGGKVAVFELTGSVVAEGDGKCQDDCTVLKLRAGETEFLTISDTGTETDAQYQLELLKIHTKPTTSKADSDKAAEALKRFLRRASLK